MGAPGRHFPTTRWTLILASRQGEVTRQTALGDLLAAYWKPVYFYFRRKGLDVEDAQDAVQGLIAQLLERDFVERLDPSRGSFRAYLRKAADHYLIDRHEKAIAMKRGRGVRMVPLDSEAIERELAAAPESPTLAYEREWALEVMERSLLRLRQEYAEGRRRGDAETIFRFFRLGEAPSYADAAAACSMTVPQFKASLHRARARLREFLREEVSDTVESEDDSRRELAELLRILSS